MAIRYSSEILGIIEGGLEGDINKVRKFAQLMADKMNRGDHMRKAVLKRLDGTYRTDKEYLAKRNKRVQ